MHTFLMTFFFTTFMTQQQATIMIMSEHDSPQTATTMTTCIDAEAILFLLLFSHEFCSFFSATTYT